MKNKEKYLDEILELFATEGVFREEFCKFRQEKILKCDCDEACKSCEECGKRVKEWLEEEYKEPIKLTEAEKVILENLDEQWKWIARDEDEMLYLFEKKPTKYFSSLKTSEWHCEWHEFFKFDCYHHLFKFIKWEDEEPYNIQKLLETCKVVDE